MSTKGNQRKEVKTPAKEKTAKAKATEEKTVKAKEESVKTSVKTAQKTTKTTKTAVKTTANTQKPKKETPKIEVKKRTKILFAAAEAMPFAASGGLAEVAGSLPKALKDSGVDARVIMPLYGDMSKEQRAKLKYLGNIYVPLAWRSQYCGIFTCEHSGVTFYFLDNEYYFKRPGLYGYFDDAERFAFLSKGVLEVLPFIDFYPDVLHSNDWHTALIPVYLKIFYSGIEQYKNIKSVFTIHNIEYQGKYSLDILSDVFGIPAERASLVEYNGLINLMKGAIECSEIFTTVSPNYAGEIKSPYFSHGLDNIINRYQVKLRGILNGIDTENYNSLTDKALFKNYGPPDFEGKGTCKTELQKMLSLPQKEDVPLVAMITRLAEHKGINMVVSVMEEILKENVQFVLLGTGDSKYENYFTDISNRYQGKFKALITFNNDLSRKIYSAADLFLMPSKTEPCGLSQMIASRYASIPIVRETGGLYDSIKPYGAGGNGFTFKNYNAHDMLYVIKEAIGLYGDKQKFKDLQKRAYAVDFSWNKSAGEYLNLYREMTN